MSTGRVAHGIACGYSNALLTVKSQVEHLPSSRACSGIHSLLVKRSISPQRLRYTEFTEKSWRLKLRRAGFALLGQHFVPTRSFANSLLDRYAAISSRDKYLSLSLLLLSVALRVPTTSLFNGQFAIPSSRL